MLLKLRSSSAARLVVAILVPGVLWFANQATIHAAGNAFVGLRGELATMGFDPERAEFLGGRLSSGLIGRRVQGRFQVAEAPGRVLEVTAVRPFAFVGWQVRHSRLDEPERADG